MSGWGRAGKPKAYSQNELGVVTYIDRMVVVKLSYNIVRYEKVRVKKPKTLPFLTLKSPPYFGGCGLKIL